MTEEPNTGNPEDGVKRQFLRELHKPDDEEDPAPVQPPDTTKANRVPKEGNISKPPPDDPRRELLRKLNGN